MSEIDALAGRPDLQIDLVEQLRTTVDRAGDLLRALEGSLAAQEPTVIKPAERIRELEHRLSTTDSDVKELTSRLVESEHQSGRLMSLYVATYQLHATLSPPEVQATIAEIAIDLLGAQQFVLLLRREEGNDCEIALRQGLPAGSGPFAGDSYEGGDPMVDATLQDGLLRLGPTEDSPSLAAVPLRVQHEIVGAIVLLKLLDHKPILRPEDRDLLDLLSAHAASALFAARLFAAKDRKLRTLESLVKLARGA